MIGIGLDPGRKEVFATVQRELHGGDVSRAFSEASVRKTQFMFSAKKYKRLSLREHMERHEKRRRRVNGGYDQALKELGTVSLKYHEQSMAYAGKWYSWFCVLRDELICQARRRRRFARFRARQRVLHYMAQTAVYGCEERSFKKNKHKLLQAYKRRRITKQIFEEKIAALKEERIRDRSRKRVVFFGAAKYGHGAPCPVQRKELVRAISLLCAVLLVHEFRTSWTCHRC